MNPKIQFKATILPLMATLMLSFVLSPVARAKQPSEDRGNGNSAAENVDALNLGTTGANNTAHGWSSLFSNTTGSSNTADGFQALYSNTTGNFNTANGVNALYQNTTGAANMAIGVQALFSNTTGFNNTATGVSALFGNTTGTQNTATGSNTLFHNTTGHDNTANGYQALFNITTGFNNTAIGVQTLFGTTIGQYNTALGFQALFHDDFNDFGQQNTAIGSKALGHGGLQNTAVGYTAMHNGAGIENTAIGVEALENNTGSYNTAAGALALLDSTTGENNAAYGFRALGTSTGHNNTAVGYRAGDVNVTTASNVICIGADVRGLNNSNSCFIGNIHGINEGGPDILPIYIDDNGQLGTQPPPSSRRFKKEIRRMHSISEAILGLKPMTFQFKSDPKGTLQFGLIAEDVAAVHPDLVVRDDNGEVYSVRYDAVNAMLLNEFLKEHQKVQKLEAALAAVNERLKVQDAKIDRVNAKIELTAPAAQVANNSQ